MEQQRETHPGKAFLSKVERETHLDLRRVLRSNFQVEEPTVQECAKLEHGTPPITDRLVQTYVAWRRAVM